MCAYCILLKTYSSTYGNFWGKFWDGWVSNFKNFGWFDMEWMTQQLYSKQVNFHKSPWVPKTVGCGWFDSRYQQLLCSYVQPCLLLNYTAYSFWKTDGFVSVQHCRQSIAEHVSHNKWAVGLVARNAAEKGKRNGLSTVRCVKIKWKQQFTFFSLCNIFTDVIEDAARSCLAAMAFDEVTLPQSGRLMAAESMTHHLSVDQSWFRAGELNANSQSVPLHQCILKATQLLMVAVM